MLNRLKEEREQIEQKLKKPQKRTELHIETQLERESIELAEKVEAERVKVESYYSRILDREVRDSLEDEVYATIASLERARNNMTMAAMRSHEMCDELEARYEDLERTEKKRRFIQPAPANSAIDHEESGHFAGGLNSYKLLLLCFMGSFAGVVVELLWCLLRNGYIESRSGLVWGPFNLLYGAGAAALSVALYRFRNRGAYLSFIGGFAVGSLLEYLCSWGQELLIGSTSWDYSAMPFNLNGRICLLYSIFWGFLGVFWMKNLYPRTAKLILKLPEKGGKILTWAFTIFFVLNIAVSGISTYRWSQRVDGVEASSAFWEVIDERFPDERMEKIFANMEFKQN